MAVTGSYCFAGLCTFWLPKQRGSCHASYGPATAAKMQAAKAGLASQRARSEQAGPARAEKPLESCRTYSASVCCHFSTNTNIVLACIVVCIKLHDLQRLLRSRLLYCVIAQLHHHSLTKGKERATNKTNKTNNLLCERRCKLLLARRNRKQRSED